MPVACVCHCSFFGRRSFERTDIHFRLTLLFCSFAIDKYVTSTRDIIRIIVTTVNRHRRRQPWKTKKKKRKIMAGDGRIANKWLIRWWCGSRVTFIIVVVVVVFLLFCVASSFPLTKHTQSNNGACDDDAKWLQQRQRRIVSLEGQPESSTMTKKEDDHTCSVVFAHRPIEEDGEGGGQVGNQGERPVSIRLLLHRVVHHRQPWWGFEHYAARQKIGGRLWPWDSWSSLYDRQQVTTLLLS